MGDCMINKNISYRLGLDIGTNSIGFALVCLKDGMPYDVIHLGSRIFSDGRDSQTKTSLAVARREARGMRRRRDRLVRRKQQLMEYLIEKGLMPKDAKERKKLELLDPYMLRKKGLDEKLELYELGRVIFHINQRRGFQSNRKQVAKENEAGAIKEATKLLQIKLEEKNSRTYGEFLSGEPVKRVRNVSSDANKVLYDFYPLRKMLEDEYDKLLIAQSIHHPDFLTSQIIEELKDTIFHQRKLRPVLKGRCSILPQEERAYKALPSSQRFRILKEVNNLTILDKLWRRNRDDLTDEQREKVITELYKRKTVSFDGLLWKSIKPTRQNRWN